MSKIVRDDYGSFCVVNPGGSSVKACGIRVAWNCRPFRPVVAGGAEDLSTVTFLGMGSALGRARNLQSREPMAYRYVIPMASEV